VEYHRVLAGDGRRVWRGILAIALVVGGMFVFGISIGVGAAYIDQLFGRTSPTFGGTDYTPLFHAGNLLPIALLIPWSMCVQRWVYGVPGPSLHSVASRFRLDVFGRAFLMIGPIWLLVSLISVTTLPEGSVDWSPVDLLAVLTISLLLTPLQSAGEEYGYRGLVLRAAASWARGPRTSLVLGVAVSTVVFTVVHFGTDVWFNVWCATIGVTLAIITWRTGGIETAVVIHALNNTISFLLVTALHTDPNALLQRSAGDTTPALLIPSALLVVITAVVWWRTRQTGPALTPPLTDTTTTRP
jgi:membrane protease YdiL (CAAX protease family)